MFVRWICALSVCGGIRENGLTRYLAAREPTQCVAGDIWLLANLKADQLSDP